MYKIYAGKVRKMASNPLKEDAHSISQGDLLEHASLGVMRNARIGLFGIKNWISGNVLNTPTKIYDINGKLLFLDFTVKEGSQILGYVRTGASKVIGLPVIAYEIGSRSWNYRTSVKECLRLAKRNYPKYKHVRTRLVCYSYPKLGIMLEMQKSDGQPFRRIYDIGTLKEVSEKKPKSGVEGVFAWSYYESLTDSERKKRIKRYDIMDKPRASLSKQKRAKIREARIVEKIDSIDAASLIYRRTVTKQLQFCPHYDYDESRSHHCFVLHGQQVADYCAVATCQMILDYYRYYYSQNDIAPALGYGPGGCPSDQSGGYETLSSQHLDAEYDASPTFEKARDEINALHPLKSGVPHHARAVAGYSYVVWIWRPLSLSITNKQLLVYDPSPWNGDYKIGGSLYWEDWDSITHTNFIYARIRT